jgi:hypothetical protein
MAPARQMLVVSGQPAPESLYAKAVRTLLQVAPQPVDCAGAVMRGQCLQVRERRFDAQGLRIEPPGEWRALDGRTEGCIHTPGVRDVLRINRCRRRQVAADASRDVYLLELVVESEQVPKQPAARLPQFGFVGRSGRRITSGKTSAGQEGPDGVHPSRHPELGCPCHARRTMAWRAQVLYCSGSGEIGSVCGGLYSHPLAAATSRALPRKRGAISRRQCPPANTP